MNRTSTARALACLLFAATPLALSAQDERLTVHGSVNIAYGKTDGLPYFGLNKDGSADYRAIALQFGYKLSEKDRVVTQLLHRKFGTSPLNAGEPDIQPVWAFYEHKFDNGTAVKVGRNPLPRGLFNEVRFIGTLLPFYRVGTQVYGETLEYIDGFTASKSFELGGDFGLESHVFGGGFNLRAQLPGSTGNIVINQRNENMIGTQLWLKTPVEGVRFGAFVSNYGSTPSATLPEASRPARTTSVLYSAEAKVDRAFARAEYTRFTAKVPSFTDYSAYYLQGGVKPVEKLTLAVEYNSATNVVRFGGAPIPNLDLPITKDIGLGATWQPSVNVAFKLEGHRNEGYGFDRPVPSVILPTAPPLVAKLAPASKAFYGLLSVAVAF
ncbi:hypothetical protein [Gemmatimonas sp.]|uniref:hypothetical protein n=1 Tax=Gemmatimonas sp. TaxID=1962908 RepID=UPI0039839138